VGEREEGEVRITVTGFSRDRFVEQSFDRIEPALTFDPALTISWIDVIGVSSVETVQAIGARFAIHPLILEDILNTRARPKLEVFDDYLYFSLKAITIDEKTGTVESQHVGIILGSNYVCTFQEGPEDLFVPIRERIKRDGRIRNLGADYLAYALVDVIVDDYFEVLEWIDEQVEFLEEQVLDRPTPATLKEIHALKRSMVDLRHVLWPLRELVLLMERTETSLVCPQVLVFFRDVYDHTIQMIETIESLRDVVAGMLDIYLSSVSFRLNQVMKVLTVFSTVFMPLTFLVGVYGMNFEFMPELHWAWSYPILWVVMILIAVTMLAWFRRKRWI